VARVLAAVACLVLAVCVLQQRPNANPILQQAAGRWSLTVLDPAYPRQTLSVLATNYRLACDRLAEMRMKIEARIRKLITEDTDAIVDDRAAES